MSETPSPPPVAPKRVVHCANAVTWLTAQPTLTSCSLVTSLPDVSELLPMSTAAWKAWFTATAELVLTRCPPEGVAIFYQTDVKRDGAWIDKAYLCSKAAEVAGCETLWHKIVCRHPPGTVTFGRHAYSHMLCFSRGVRHALAGSTADVLPDAGATAWERGMGIDACRVACAYVRDHTDTRTVVDPFCGRGTVLAVANARGLDAVGVEIHRRRARQARALRIELP